MTIYSVEITFSKTVLIEKSLNKQSQEIVDELCKEVPKSFLHCIVHGTGRGTIIRYSKLNNGSKYCVLRIIYFKPFNTDKIVVYSSEELNSDIPLIRLVLYHNSSGEYTYKTHLKGLQITDTKPLICYKDSLGEAILRGLQSIYELNDINRTVFIHDKNNAPMMKIVSPSQCDYLYGKMSNNYRGDVVPYFQKSEFSIFESDVNSWWLKLKRKGRRRLIKSLTLEPI